MLTLLVLLVPSLVFLEELEAEGPIQVDHIPVDPIDLVHNYHLEDIHEDHNLVVHNYLEEDNCLVDHN